jgi:hypothetical protein
LQGCSRLKLQLPLPVASAAPKGKSSARQQLYKAHNVDHMHSHVSNYTKLQPHQHRRSNSCALVWLQQTAGASDCMCAHDA